MPSLDGISLKYSPIRVNEIVKNHFINLNTHTHMLMFCIWNIQKNIMNIILLIDILYPLCFLPKVNFSFLIVLCLKFKFFVSPQWGINMNLKKKITLLINIKYNLKHLEKFQNWIMKKCFFFCRIRHSKFTSVQ